MENRLDESNDMAVSPCPLAFTALCQIMKIWREKVDRPIMSKGTPPRSLPICIIRESFVIDIGGPKLEILFFSRVYSIALGSLGSNLFQQQGPSVPLKKNHL